MATKIYLPRLAQTVGISPAIASGWASAPSLVRAQAKTTTGSDANANVTITDTNSTLQNICAVQYIAPLKAGQIVHGAQAIQFVCQFQETTSNNNMNSAFGIRVLASDGSTLRKEVLAVAREVNEMVASPTVPTNRNNTATSVAGDYTTVDGDFLVIEVGAGGDPSGSSPHTYVIRLGNATATFLTANDTGTSSTDNNSPWVQLNDTLILEPSMTVAFIGPTVSLFTPGVSQASFDQTLTGAFISSGSALSTPTVAPDAVTLTLPSISATALFGATVLPQAVTLTGAFIASGNVLYTQIVQSPLYLTVRNDAQIGPTSILYAPPLIEIPFQSHLTGAWRQELITGADGSTVIFNLNAAPQSDSLLIFINGFHQTDYTIVGSTVTFGIAPNTGDVLLACYCATSFPAWRHETLIGANGSNPTFILNEKPATNSLFLLINGFYQRNYVLNSKTIVLDVPPETGDEVSAYYFV